MAYRALQEFCYTWFPLILRGAHVWERRFTQANGKFCLSGTCHRSEYDVLWRGVEWEAGEVEIPVFLRAPRSAPKLSCVGVSAGRRRSESWKGSRTNNTLNIVRSWAFPRLRGRSSRRRLDAEVLTHSSPRKGGRMPCFFLLQCRRNCKGEQARFNNMFRNITCGSNEPDLHSSCIKMEEKESRHPPSFRRSGTGLKPPGDRTTVWWSSAESLRGSGMEKLWGSDVRASTRAAGGVSSVPRRVNGNGHLDFSRLPLDPPAKEIKLASVTGSRKAEFSIRLSEPPLWDVRTPKNKGKTSIPELMQSPVFGIVRKFWVRNLLLCKNIHLRIWPFLTWPWPNLCQK